MTDDVHDPVETGVIPAPQIPGQPGPVDAELRTFLIADVRGYTSFTQRRGDEAAAKLAAKFARVAREVVELHRGTVLELRGDEALCVFVSPRQAVRASVALQRRLVDETRWDPELPLPVGIGIDVGEAVPVEGGYRSGALNLAARLCSIARPGEILASAELTHLARQLDGMSYVPREMLRLKGLADPVRPIRIVPDGDDPVVQLAGLGALPPKQPVPFGPHWLPSPMRSRRRLIAAAVVVAVLAGGLAVVTTRGGGATTLASLRENVAAVIDVGSGRLAQQMSVGASPDAIAVGTDAVWVASSADDTISRLDRRTGKTTQTTHVGDAPTAVVVGGDAVWVANSGSGSVSRVNPATGQVTQTIPVGSGPSALAFDRGVVWVVDTTGGALFRINTGDATAALVTRVGAAPAAVAAVDGEVWVSSPGSGTVMQVDTTTARVIQTVHVGNDPRGLALAGGSLWVANNLDGTVTRVDTATGAVSATLPVGAGPVAVADSPQAVWVANEDGLSVTRIDPRSNRVVKTIRTGSAPTAITFGDHRVWLTAGSNPVLHRGGTLTVSEPDVMQLDPAQGYDVASETVQLPLFDGLVGLRRTEGAAGGTVVPDLAQSLPSVSDDGRTYVFHLRSGIQWSTGQSVTGADVRRGLERTVAARIWPLYGGIVGAGRCTPSRCDLSQGVHVDSTRLITIRLAAADSEFLYKLALPGAVAVPEATPLGPLGHRPLASTGPYRVASYTSKHVAFDRNPRFRQWSSAAQPDAFPDRVDISVNPDPGPGQKWSPPAVDWATTNRVPDLAALQAKFGSRVKERVVPATHALFLNASIPPFNNVQARRAVAFAVDREAVAAHWAFPGRVTCNILPPGIPGYSPYCPFTLRPDASGEWHAPDLATAQHLVQQSGTAGAQVVLYAPAGLVGLSAVVDAMRSIGYRAHLVWLPQQSYFNDLGKLRARMQAGFGGWLADYPAASNFFLPQLSCAARDFAAGGSNYSAFCDPTLDRQMARAAKLQVTSPGAALALWTEIDRAAVDAAPLVPLINPTKVEVVSTRLGHDERSPIFGPLFAQAWVR